MNDTINKGILLALAERWELDASYNGPVDGSPEAQKGNNIEQGIREGKRESADALRMLIALL